MLSSLKVYQYSLLDSISTCIIVADDPSVMTPIFAISDVSKPFMGTMTQSGLIANTLDVTGPVRSIIV